MTTETEKKYYKSSLGLKKDIAPAVAADYHSGIVDWMRANENRLDAGDVSFRLAKEFGFCYGVDKAVDMAYETRAKFPDRRIFLTYEIIHNPRVNNRLREMGIRFLSGTVKDGFGFDDITAQDVVIMPAFGVSAPELERLKKIGCVLVDTTCGSVVHVWKRVERYAKDGFTSLVHGKALHAETIATTSQAQKLGGHTIVVLNHDQAQLVCDIIAGKRAPEDVFELGPNALSEGFDPHKHLARIGVANQTTMLASESLSIAAKVGESLKERYGADHIDKHFRSFDTICSATQERQDAIIELINSGELDVMLVIGGYNSSNTGHLLEIAAEKVRAYHICDADEILSLDRIRHKPEGQKTTIESDGWLPNGPVTIGMTAGASTPNRAIGEAISRLAQLRGLTLDVPVE